MLLPENSWPVPGKEQVSFRYGVSHPKYLLLKSKNEIASAFKQLHSDCNFSKSTIMREFPQYAVSPTSRDLERNTCPVHANARRLIKAINNKLRLSQVASNLPSSCRELVLLILCKSSVVTSDPLTWPVACIKRTCKDCSTIELDIVSNEVLNQTITFSQWQSKKQLVNIKGKQNVKYIYSLYTKRETLKVAINQLKINTSDLALHIYTAHRQWEAHSEARKKLCKNTIITVEDYQMNLEAVYSENPTSMAYAGNKVTVALYPICVEYISDNGEHKKQPYHF